VRRDLVVIEAIDRESGEAW